MSVTGLLNTMWMVSPPHAPDDAGQLTLSSWTAGCIINAWKFQKSKLWFAVITIFQRNVMKIGLTYEFCFDFAWFNLYILVSWMSYFFVLHTVFRTSKISFIHIVFWRNIWVSFKWTPFFQIWFYWTMLHSMFVLMLICYRNIKWIFLNFSWDNSVFYNSVLFLFGTNMNLLFNTFRGICPICNISGVQVSQQHEFSFEKSYWSNKHLRSYTPLKSQ